VTNQQIQPQSIAPPAARYVHAVATSSATKWLHTSGVVPIRPDGTVPEDIGEQAIAVWDNIAAMLGDAAMTAGDIVSVTTYVVPGQDLSSVMAARDAFMGEHLAASTLLVVPELAQPSWKMEIAIVAAH